MLRFCRELRLSSSEFISEDFDIPAEWHFHGTAHSKGICGGIGANIKTFAARSSLQCSSKHHILTPQTSFQWAKSNCKETEIFFSSKESYAIATEILKGRFNQPITIPGTLQYHAFISTQDRKLLMKKFSFFEKYDIFPKGQKRNRRRGPRNYLQKRKKSPRNTILWNKLCIKRQQVPKNKIHQTPIQIIHPDKQKYHFPTHSITRYEFNRFNFQNIFQINLTLTVIQAL